MNLFLGGELVGNVGTKEMGHAGDGMWVLGHAGPVAGIKVRAEGGRLGKPGDAATQIMRNTGGRETLHFEKNQETPALKGQEQRTTHRMRLRRNRKKKESGQTFETHVPHVRKHTFQTDSTFQRKVPCYDATRISIGQL